VNDSPVTGRRVWAALQLLDRQLRARGGALCGNVDDIELRRDEQTGVLYASAILSGPGRLLGRLGHRRFGDWLARLAVDGDPTRVPFEYVRAIGPVVELGLDADQVGSHLGERWARDHLIAHIPGSGHEAE
jgi:hypothetical protein